MPNEIKQEPTSTPMADESGPEMVPKSELDKLKRKLDETEPELRKCKRKLMESEAEMEADRKKLKQFKTLVATDMQFRPRRETIRLTLPTFAKSARESVASNRIEIAGFRWELTAASLSNGTLFGLFLYAYPPADYKGPFEFEFVSPLQHVFLQGHPQRSEQQNHSSIAEKRTWICAQKGSFKIHVDFSFRILGRQPSEDLTKTGIDPTDEDDGGRLELLAWEVPRLNEDMLLLDSFLQSDGSVQVELDFTFRKSGDEEDEDSKSSSNEEEESGSNEGDDCDGEEAGKEDFSWMIGKCVRFRGKRARR